jgi:hypothetical protein
LFSIDSEHRQAPIDVLHRFTAPLRRVNFERPSPLRFSAGGSLALAGIAALLMLASGSAEHGGITTFFIGLLFITAAGVGASYSLRPILVAVIALEFIEPEILLTRSVPINPIGEGLILGAAVGWLFGRRSIPTATYIPAALIGTFVILHFAMPIAVGIWTWTGSYEAIVIARYPLLIFLSASTFRHDHEVRWLLLATAVGSLVVGVAGLIESFRIGNINIWLNEWVVSWQRLTSNEIEEAAFHSTRIRGLFGAPIQTGAALAISLGVWLIALFNTDSFWRRLGLLLALSVIIFTWFGTGTRTGYLAFGSGVLMAIIWVIVYQRGQLRITGTALITLLVIPVFILIMSVANSDVRQTLDIAYHRTVDIPVSLLTDGEKVNDESVAKRIWEFDNTPLTLIGTDPTSLQGRDNEYFDIILSYGVIPVFPYIAFWLLMAWMATRRLLRVRDSQFTLFVLWLAVTSMTVALGKSLFFDPVILVLSSVAFGALIGLDTQDTLTRTNANEHAVN